MNHQDLINTCVFEQIQGLLFSDLSGPLTKYETYNYDCAFETRPKMYKDSHEKNRITPTDFIKSDKNQSTNF